jgi:hypothetical protein
MARLLLNRSNNALVTYPRQDDEPVVGLDRFKYHVVEVIREAKPELDPVAFSIQLLDPVIVITDPNGEINGTATYGWEVIQKPPEPAWDQFSLSALADPGLNLAVLAADPTAPNAARGLSAALLEAKLQGEYVNFAACWQAVVSVAQIPPSRVAELVGLAQACHLPQAFIDAISPI